MLIRLSAIDTVILVAVLNPCIFGISRVDKLCHAMIETDLSPTNVLLRVRPLADLEIKRGHNRNRSQLL